MVLWPAFLAMPWHKWAIISGGVLLLLGLMMAFASGRMNARAMGRNILKGQIDWLMRTIRPSNSREMMREGVLIGCSG